MDWAGWALFGLVATAALTAVMIMAQLAGLTRLDLPLLLGTIVTEDPDRARVAGFFLHLVIGQGFALGYAASFSLLDRATWWLGGLLGSGEVLRLTIEFADGRSVTNLDPAPSDPEVPAFEQPMLSRGAGTGGGVGGWSFDMEYRVRPLPPPGPLAFACVWPARGIPSARVEVDGAAILEAADVAVTLWSDDPYCSAD
jgi:hypothetical protein